jgi:NAD(P)-dependent dehydrogenase (short-subunit alcohol dehydrogenase family)
MSVTADGGRSRRRLGTMRILITGGTSGLGLAMARALADDGHRIVITGRAADRAAEVAATLSGEVHGIGMDVRDGPSVRSGRDRTIDLLGGLDVLVNNAGIGMRTVNPRFLTDPQPFWQVPESGFRDVIDTNLTGYFLVASAVVPDLLASPGGQIINVTMNHATMTRPGFVPYGPSRAGAESLSRIMAADLAGTGVRVNLLLPGGATATGMIPDDRADISGLLPAEIMAEPVRWLCSPAAAEIHDQRIVATDFQSPPLR